MLGFSADETLSTFQVASSVLKLGNVQFQPRANMDGTESCSLVNEYEVYEVSELLQGEVSVLQAALTQRTVETRHDVIVTDLSATEANYARNALCKALYSRLFTWLVNRINDTIRVKRKCIGMLDIYGFEVLEFNSFEQLIINYCNEKLQQILIELTLKAEQEEYIREGIQWEHIDYFNNAVICDLIEKSKNDLDLSLQNHHGILALLDEECLRPGPVSDETFLYKLTQACQDNPYFESRGCRNFVADSTLPHHSFRVRHYAGAVTYSVTGFIDKNNDILHRDLSQAMYKTDQPLLKTLFPEDVFPNDSFRQSSADDPEAPHHHCHSVPDLSGCPHEKHPRAERTLRQMHQAKRAQATHDFRNGSRPAPSQVSRVDGERAHAQERLRPPAGLRVVPAALQDALPQHVAHVVRPARGRGHQPAEVQSRPQLRLLLRQDQDLPQAQQDRELFSFFCDSFLLPKSVCCLTVLLLTIKLMCKFNLIVVNLHHTDPEGVPGLGPQKNVPADEAEPDYAGHQLSGVEVVGGVCACVAKWLQKCNVVFYCLDPSFPWNSKKAEARACLAADRPLSGPSYVIWAAYPGWKVRSCTPSKRKQSFIFVSYLKPFSLLDALRFAV
ncbi:unconventional myosin-Ib [Caerostris extrusa]|uniref:Unconventional myosin-Ib n=1 Tax=Caerostris extrusa TaxID=172846 RepID=A0AAV4TJ64_CAEEX|nr:unconventional myosin-Ib [Caerostris extrusa]